MSHNEDKSKASQTTTNNVSNLNVQDTDGVTVVGDGNVVSDYGAISRAFDFGTSAINGMADVSMDAINLGREGLSAGTDNLNLGLGFAENVLGDSYDVVDSVVAGLAQNQDSALDFLSNLVDSFGQSAQKFTDQAISGFETLAVKSSESADDRVGKVALWAFAAVAAIMIWGRK